MPSASPGRRQWFEYFDVVSRPSSARVDCSWLAKTMRSSTGRDGPKHHPSSHHSSALLGLPGLEIVLSTSVLLHLAFCSTTSFFYFLSFRRLPSTAGVKILDGHSEVNNSPFRSPMLFRLVDRRRTYPRTVRKLTRHSTHSAPQSEISLFE